LITARSNTLSFSGFASRALSTFIILRQWIFRLAHEELIEWVKKRIAELEEELSKMREILSVLESQQVTVQSAETFTEEDLAALPWRSYQSGKGEWIFADKAPKALVERLEREGQVELGGYLTSSPPLRARVPSGRITGSRFTAFILITSQLVGDAHPAPFVQR
jgi:hypothetical protein